MPVTRTGLKRGSANNGVGPERLSDALLKGRYCFENFGQEPLNTKAGLLLAPGGTALQPCLIFTGRHTFQWATTVDETDEFYPTLGTDGGYNWQIASTPVILDGIEINFGGDTRAHPRTYLGAGEEFFARVLLNLTDASGADVIFGFKKVALTVASITEITDIVGIRILGDSGSTAGAVTVVTNLNNGGTSDIVSTATSLQLEDLTAVELEVRGVGGKAWVYLNGVWVAGQPAFTFDSGDYLTPILRLAQTTDTTATYKTFAFECGLLPSRRPETLLQLASTTS